MTAVLIAELREQPLQRFFAFHTCWVCYEGFNLNVSVREELDFPPFAWDTGLHHDHLPDARQLEGDAPLV